MANDDKKLSKNLEKILKFLTQIPAGKVTTYKAIALKLGLGSSRYVGSLLHKNTNPQKYPCHRVVKSDGKIALGYAFGGQKAQLLKLQKEKVPFLKNGTTVDLARALYS